MIRRPPRSTQSRSSAASDVYKRQDTDMHAAPGTTRAILAHLAPDVEDDTHPRDLSEGQRLALALAVVLAGKPPLVLLDEPTRGLDYGAKTRLVASLRLLAAEQHGVLVATHD